MALGQFPENQSPEIQFHKSPSTCLLLLTPSLLLSLSSSSTGSGQATFPLILLWRQNKTWSIKARCIKKKERKQRLSAYFPKKHCRIRGAGGQGDRGCPQACLEQYCTCPLCFLKAMERRTLPLLEAGMSPATHRLGPRGEKGEKARVRGKVPPLDFDSVQSGHSVVSNSLRPHGLHGPHASLSITTSQSLLRLMCIESVMPSNHLILWHPLLPPSIFPSISVFSNESVLLIREPKDWSFSFSISPSSEYSGLISFRMDWLDLAVQGTLESFFQHHNSKASTLQHSAFFIVQL